MIVDTSALLAYFDLGEPAHAEVARVIGSAQEALVVPPFVVAEVDYLVATRHGVDAELAVVRELAGGARYLAMIDREQLEICENIVDRYADQAIGTGDASIVVLADRLGTRTIPTLDRQHFDVLRPVRGGRFRVLP